MIFSLELLTPNPAHPTDRKKAKKESVSAAYSSRNQLKINHQALK
jgi:hypothetical protein